MTQVSITAQVNASPDQVWRLIGGFDALPDWHPLITRSEAQEGGRIRRLTLADGAVVIERLLSFSENDRTYGQRAQAMRISSKIGGACTQNSSRDRLVSEFFENFQLF